MKKIQVSTNEAPKAAGPYSQGITAGDLVFVSGMIPVDKAGVLVTGGIKEQIKQVMENLSAVLNAAGSSLDNVLKTTIYLNDMNNFATVNEMYGKYYKTPYPAGSCVEVSRLPKDVLIEIEAVAVKNA